MRRATIMRTRAEHWAALAGQLARTLAILAATMGLAGNCQLAARADENPAPERGDSNGKAEPYIPGRPLDWDYADLAQTFIENHCLDCHNQDDPAGNLSLEDLGPVDELNAGVWKSVWAQVTLQEMPPRDMPQPEAAQRLRFTDWTVAQLRHVMRDSGGFTADQDPNKGNFLHHDLLFGPLPVGLQLVPTASPARIWRVSPEEHLTRLNELINTEPAYNAAKPGLRTHGDAVPTNHGGELKLYFGTDRITRWQGGTVAYATAVKSIPSILSSARKHGLENYPYFYSVNSAEAAQIINAAQDILRYMAYGPLSIANPEQITDDPKSYKMEGDIRGLPTSLVYSSKTVRPMTPIYDLMQGDEATDLQLRAAVDYLFEALVFRPPMAKESEAYVGITRDAIQRLGKTDGAMLGLSAVFLDRDALFRPELATGQDTDPHGRTMLQDWELGLAVNHALRYLKPDRQLREAITQGRMRTREDVRREVQRMLDDDQIRKPRLLRFFRDFFDYDLGGYICKDEKSLAATGLRGQGNRHYRAMFDATASTDRLVELILREDRDVLRRLLTTQQVVATGNDKLYFGRQRTAKERREAVAAAKVAEREAVKLAKQQRQKLAEEVDELQKLVDQNPRDQRAKRRLKSKKKALETAPRRAKAAKKRRAEANHNVAQADLDGPKIFARVGHRSFGNGSLKPERILTVAPAKQRMGILTHPSWLVSHSDAMDNHAIRRGHWIRERLLGGGIPDVPITVDAMLPDEPQHTLRHRMRVTREEVCWTCHKKMDPLGLPFEMYNHAGLYRTHEQGEPVDSTGEVIDSGDASLDGKVANAIELIDRLASSERVAQVFVRHAFRFWIGRNETLHDRAVLQDAYQAYRDNGGSMKAMLVSLLSSDAFIYRTVEGKPAAHGAEP